MICKNKPLPIPRIRNFENLGFGLFVHFGLYSVLGMGEWAKFNRNIPWEEYIKLFNSFNPNENWAEELVLTAKKSGCKYITLTTRHHEGFSLFDTCGLSTFDAPHACGRDLVSEFVDACNRYDIIPFFYHTLLDWHEESYNKDFSKYLIYLRNSVEILCKNYGTIGGFWFDGAWDKPNACWEEDALYALIRKWQPNAIIINNTGLHERGKLGHGELDSVTFERGKPQTINFSTANKYVASEMCEVFADHWGYAKMDLNYKSASEIIESFSACRRFKSNFLLNIGPKEDGSLRLMDKALLEVVGCWSALNKETLCDTEPTDIIIENKPKDFIIQKDNVYYLFVHDLKMIANINVTLNSNLDLKECFPFDKKIESVTWLDNGENLVFEQENNKATIITRPFPYGESFVVRVAKILT